MQKKARVYNYPYKSQGHWQLSLVPQVRSRKGSYLRGGADRTGELLLTSEVFHAMHVIPSLKLGGSRWSRSPRPWPASEDNPTHGSACGPDPDSDLYIPESSSCLLPRPVWDCLVLPGSCWWDASARHPTPGNSVSVLYILYYLF